MTLELAARVPARDVEVELEVGAGETVALLGPNGAGKSTVLSVAAGLVVPDAGRVVLDGRVLTDAAPGARRRVQVPPHDRRTALLAQDASLFPHLDALDNVAFGPRSAGAGRRTARDAARRWLAAVGAEDLAHRRPRQLSGGQAQRVALARALAAEPALLLLDEPMAALDVGVTPALRQVLRRVLADRTVLLVTHDVLDAVLLADRVVVLDAGRVVEQGATGDVLARPRSDFAARVAGLNLVRGAWRDGALHSPDGLRIEGMAHGPALRDGDASVAVFEPQAVSVFLAEPGGSPRNALSVVVTELEPRGGQVRIRAGALAADVTPRAVADLDLAPGRRVVLAVKAHEVAVYGT
ncbi:sulfate/molybdate ABC transporter ATP-binding protein [Nocardioides solisilvae]|uniref:sulfate/molybdate ABC transporter ATP-binding protein n=1 Tax=Nocardioides solisilvae TaxID=1542435 RepID=UPI000D74EBCD|nr:ATP-binding cassette domain-containing protein [Nocardioides solisilvae]